MFDKDVLEAILISVSVPALIVAVIGFSAYVIFSRYKRGCGISSDKHEVIL